LKLAPIWMILTSAGSSILPRIVPRLAVVRWL
jgi:hypothetical protein